MGALLLCAALVASGVAAVPGSSVARASEGVTQEAETPPPPTPASGSASPREYQVVPAKLGPVVHDEGISRPLRDLPQLRSVSGYLRPSIEGGPAAPNMPSALGFDGLSRSGVSGAVQPDTVGDVGPNYYVQAVSTALGVFAKSDGTPLATVTFDSLFDTSSVTTDGCKTGHHKGHPAVVYDRFHDRWIVADVGWTDSADAQTGPYYWCLALSTTSDPSGAWYLNAFETDVSDTFTPPPYYLAISPHMALWSDSLFMSSNLVECGDSTCTTQTPRGVRTWAFDLSYLIATHSVRPLWADLGTDYASILPATLHGLLPPSGAPGYFLALDLSTAAVDVWKFTYVWGLAPHATLDGPTQVTVDSYTSPPAVPQLDTGQTLDPVGGQLMPSLPYRHIGAAESVWVSHTVGSGGTAAIRWYQLDVTGGTIATAPVQSGTYQPDSSYRWLPSLAVDHAGNMAIGYSASSSSIHPEIRYGARRWTDPADTLGLGENTMVDASLAQGSQTGSSAWGAQSSMTVDPTNDCTFWYTNEYYGSTGSDWLTRIGSFTLVRPTLADFDCNGTSDLAVYRPSNGVWYMRDQYNSGWGGQAGDVPAPGDYNGDGKADVTIYRPSTGVFYVKNVYNQGWGGQVGDVPVPGDYNGDGKTDVAIWRPSTGVFYVKYVFNSGWGEVGDIPVPGDYNGDGTTDVAAFRPSNNVWYIKGIGNFAWGQSGDIPVPGDYNGDGTTDIAVWRPSTGTWYVRGQPPNTVWGTSTDIPIPGDYNGDGTTDLAVYIPSSGTWSVKDQFDKVWGAPGDYPVEAPDTNGDGDPYQ